MRGACSRARFAATLGLALAGPCVFALNPAQDVSQYAHDSWTYRQGLARGYIHSIVETPDGYLWLGTESGLLRFDGVRSSALEPQQGESLSSTNLTTLLAARDGTLWIGSRNGLASRKNGSVTQYSDLAGLAIFALLEDLEGRIWVGAYGLPSGKFCEIRGGNVRCHPEAAPGRGVLDLDEDIKRNLWVFTETGIWRWKPGPPKFYPLVLRDSSHRMAEGGDGAILVGMKGGVGRFADGKLEMAYPFPVLMREPVITRMLRDRDGGLWVGTRTGGVVHIHQGRTDVYSHSDGLTSDNVTGLFEDREGNVWVATTNGLDRFRELPVTTYSVSQGLSSNFISTVLGAKDGTIWIGVPSGLDRLSGDKVTAFRLRSVPAKAASGEIAVSGMPDGSLESLFQDSRARIWVSSATAVGYLEGTRFIPSGVPGGDIFALAEDTAGNIWVANQDLGLYRLSPSNEVWRIPWETLSRQGPGTLLAADPVHGGLWIGFFNGGITEWRDGQVRASYSVSNGLGHGRINHLRFEKNGALWAATEGGLSRLKDGRIATLTRKNGLPCDAVHWTIEDDAQSVWLKMPCGLVRVAQSELEAWAAATDRTIHVAVFDGTDGVRLTATAGSISPPVAKDGHGRLWFVSLEGIGVVDPRDLPFNKLPPPVHVEQVIADRKTYAAGAKLPPLVRDVEIDYTALSFVAPEKNRFRYKLEGHDRDWVDAGTRRQAFYNDLPPRSYRFRVMASNNDGVWNEAGASLDFSIVPAYYQTTWFAALAVAAVLAVLTGLHRLRLLYLTKQFNARLEGRVSERTRVARDLHDTLLQSFQGTLLKFHSVSYMLPNNPEAQKSLESCIEQARAAIAEGRDAVQGLRSSTVVANDLARAVTTFGGGLVADQPEQTCPEFLVQVQGKSRDLPPLVRDEIYRIACESLRNAFRHAQAKRIEVEICYDSRHFRLRVVDNGKGIDPAVLSAGGRAGHHGLPGLHERAQLVGGKLSVWSQLNSGTEIELTIPAAIAYTRSKTPAAKTAGATNAGKEHG